MNTNPEKFPLLSFVLSRLNADTSAPLPSQKYDNLTTTFPHLVDAKVIASLIEALPVEIAQTHFLLSSLRPRPDPETVASARSRISQIQETSPEVEMCRAVVRLDEMHEEYAMKLGEAEEILGRVYGSVVAALEAIRELQGLAYINLSHNQSEFIPDSIAGLQKLEKLNLSSNLLRNRNRIRIRGKRKK